MEKVIFVEDPSDSDELYEVNDLLNNGWVVKSVTPQNVGAAASGSLGSRTRTIVGGFLFVLKSE